MQFRNVTKVTKGSLIYEQYYTAGQGLGCALYHKQNEKRRIFGIENRTPVGAKKKYPS